MGHFCLLDVVHSSSRQSAPNWKAGLAALGMTQPGPVAHSPDRPGTWAHPPGSPFSLPWGTDRKSIRGLPQPELELRGTTHT